MRPALEIRGLEALQKRFAALGAVKDLGPALRAEAEALADAAREKLRERDPQSQAGTVHRNQGVRGRRSSGVCGWHR